MDKLSKEEVLHISNLAKIEINDSEIEEYSSSLKTLLNEIDKIKDVKVKDDDMMYNASCQNAAMREDIESDTKSFEDIKKNVPKSMGNFVEVVVMLNE